MNNDSFQPMLPIWDSEGADHGSPSPTDADPPVGGATVAARRSAHGGAGAPSPHARAGQRPRPRPCLPPVITTDDLTGSLGLRMLIRLGAVVPLDDMHVYRRDDGKTLYGRAAITAAILPRHLKSLTICGRTAAWVWLGGDFPTTIDVLSNSHYRTRVLGRPIRTRARHVPTAQITSIGALKLTTPERTACDLALSPIEEIQAHDMHRTIIDLMRQYEFDQQPCLHILDGCSYLHTAKQAREVLADFTCIA